MCYPCFSSQQEKSQLPTTPKGRLVGCHGLNAKNIMNVPSALGWHGSRIQMWSLQSKLVTGRWCVELTWLSLCDFCWQPVHIHPRLQGCQLHTLHQSPFVSQMLNVTNCLEIGPVGLSATNPESAAKNTSQWRRKKNQRKFDLHIRLEDSF